MEIRTIVIPDEKGNEITYHEISDKEFLDVLDKEFETLEELSSAFNFVEDPFRPEYENVLGFKQREIVSHPYLLMTLSRIKKMSREYVNADKPILEYDNFLNASATVFKRYQALADSYIAATEEGFVYFKSNKDERVMAVNEESLGLLGNINSFLDSDKYVAPPMSDEDKELYI